MGSQSGNNRPFELSTEFVQVGSQSGNNRPFELSRVCAVRQSIW